MIKNFIIYQYQKYTEALLMKQFDGRFAAMFHQVDDDAGNWYDKRYAISFRGFQNFVGLLRDKGYAFVTPYKLLEEDGRKKVVLTFDDVFEGVYRHVYPFLKQQNIPFVIFPCISKMQQEGYVTAKMLREMTEEYENCYVGGHSLSHCNLRKAADEISRKEIRESGEILQRVIGKSVDLFAYPYGSPDAVGKRERSIAHQNYLLSFGTLQAGVTAKVDPAYIPRINVNEENYDRKGFIPDEK